MTDLHTHILPGIDDGAQSIQESIELLRAQLKGGISTVALTPHFNPTAMGLAEFLEQRRQSCVRLVSAAREQGVKIRMLLGAEVTFTPELTELDLSPLCYEGTRTILIELPWDRYPPYVGEVLYRLMMKGYRPLLAHVERYPYFAKNPHLLEELVQTGSLTQANAESMVYGGRTRKRILRMISDGIVHVLASDTHSIYGRPPLLHKAVRVVEKKIGSDVARELVSGGIILE